MGDGPGARKQKTGSGSVFCHPQPFNRKTRQQMKLPRLFLLVRGSRLMLVFPWNSGANAAKPPGNAI